MELSLYIRVMEGGELVLSEIKRLGDAELEIMLLIWGCDIPVSSNYVLEKLRCKRKWGLSTVMTSLSRLCEKGFIKCDRATGNNLYSPLIFEQDYKSKENKSFLEKMYGNSFQSLVASFYSNKVIDKTDLSELRNFLNELEEKEKE